MNLFSTNPSSLSKEWKLVWNDEFNYTGLPDTTKWSYHVGGSGWGNEELQFYTENRLENARVENGTLIIEAKKEPWQGMNYTSARLHTRYKGDWQYGKIEVKAKLPKGRGTWPAIWMLSSNITKWPEDGEVDIMEHVGYDQGVINASVHCKKYNWRDNTHKKVAKLVADCSDQFHVYGMEWNVDSIQISVDGGVFFSFANDHTGYDAWPFDNKLFLILNIAIGGNYGGAKGVDDSIWPQKMEVEYVRVW